MKKKFIEQSVPRKRPQRKRKGKKKDTNDIGKIKNEQGILISREKSAN